MKKSTSKVFARKALACGLVLAMVATGPVFSPEKSVSHAKKASSVTVSSQKELKKALKKNVKTIVIGKKVTNLNIPSGNYGKTNLVVNSPKASITNSGKFNSIDIRGNAAKSWTEKSKAKNNITVSSKKPVDLKIDAKAKVGNLIINGSGTTESNISISGKVGNVTIKGTMSVNISAEGSGKVTKVVISASVTVSVGTTGKASVAKIDVSAKGADVGITATGNSSIGSVDVKTSAGSDAGAGDKDKTKVEIKADDNAKIDNVKTAAENTDVAVISDGESTVSTVKVEGDGSASVSGDSQNITTVDVKDAGDNAKVTINTPTVQVEAGESNPVSNIVDNQSGQDIKTNVTKQDGTTETVIQPSIGGNTPSATTAPAATTAPSPTTAPTASTAPQGSAAPGDSSGGGSSSGGGGGGGGGSSSSGSSSGNSSGGSTGGNSSKNTGDRILYEEDFPSDCRKLEIVDEEVISESDGSKKVFIGLKNNSTKRIDDLTAELHLYDGKTIVDEIYAEDDGVGLSSLNSGQRIMFMYVIPSDANYKSYKIAVSGGEIGRKYTNDITISNMKFDTYTNYEGDDQDVEVQRLQIAPDAKNNSPFYLERVEVQVLVKRNNKFISLVTLLGGDIPSGNSDTVYDQGDYLEDKGIKSTDQLSVYAVGGFQIDDTEIKAYSGNDKFTYEDKGLSVSVEDVNNADGPLIKRYTNNSSKDVLIERELYYYKGDKLIYYSGYDRTDRDGVLKAYIASGGDVYLRHYPLYDNFDRIKVHTHVYLSGRNAQSEKKSESVTLSVSHDSRHHYATINGMDTDPTLIGVEIQWLAKDSSGNIEYCKVETKSVSNIGSDTHSPGEGFDLSGNTTLTVTAEIVFYDRVTEEQANAIKSGGKVQLVSPIGNQEYLYTGRCGILLNETDVVRKEPYDIENDTVVLSGQKKKIGLWLKPKSNVIDANLSYHTDLFYRVSGSGMALTSVLVFMFDNDGNLLRVVEVPIKEYTRYNERGIQNLVVKVPNIDFSSYKIVSWGQIVEKH